MCGPNQLDQNSENLYQLEEGQRAHTIKFMSNPINLPTNLPMNNKASKPKNEFSKNTLAQNLNKEISLKNNKNPLESNKCSNNTSELEIIEYPTNEFKKNDIKSLNDIIISKAKDYINDKSQNDILDYLKEKQGLNYLSLLLENDNNSNNSRIDKNDNSSKSDEIICSYVEVDHNNSIISRMQKEKSVIKQSSKIYSQIHQSSYSDYSLAIQNSESFNNNKGPKTIYINKSKNKNEEKKIKVNKNMKKIKTDMKFKKIVNHINHSNNNAHFKKKKIGKEDGIRSFMEAGQNENIKIKSIIESNKKKLIFNKKNKLDTFRSIEYLNEFNTINQNYKHILNTINVKNKKSSGKSQIINSERTKTNFQINKNINTIKSKDKNYSYKSKNIKGNSINSKSKIDINRRSKINKNENPLFNSINFKKNKITNNKKGNFLSLKKSLLNPMRIDSKNKIKTENITTFNSKYKLPKQLMNNMNNSKHKCDLSMYNIKSINNNTKLLIKKEKNKTLNKMNKSEVDKKINNSSLKNNVSENKKSFRNNFIQMSISKILKINQY